MTKLGEVCRHGALRRQCEICDLADALDIERRTSERNRLMCEVMQQDLAAAREAVQVAWEYATSYLLDELHEPDLCVNGQHERTVELFKRLDAARSKT